MLFYEEEKGICSSATKRQQVFQRLTLGGMCYGLITLNSVCIASVKVIYCWRRQGINGPCRCDYGGFHPNFQQFPKMKLKCMLSWLSARAVEGAVAILCRG